MYWNIVNTAAVLGAGIGWWICTRFFIRPEILNGFPLSTFMVLGFASTQCYLPVLFTTLEAKPVTFNLEAPMVVYTHILLTLAMLVMTHAFYRLLSRMTYNPSFSLFAKAGFYNPPHELQFWLMGAIGMAASFYGYFSQEAVEVEVTGAASDKFVQALMPFAYVPYFLLFRNFLGDSQTNIKRIVPLLVLYTIVIFLVGLGRNSRGAFVEGIAAVGFSYFLGLLLGYFNAKVFTWKHIAGAVFAIWIMLGPVADLGTAMVIVRGQRDDVPAREMIDLTWEAFWDKEAIENRRADDMAYTHDDWDERYLDNILFARFANLKFNDISLLNASVVREYDPDMLNFSIDYVLSILPEPMLAFFNIDVDKETTRSLSMGDYLYLAAGGGGTVSGFRTGHIAGSGMATFGWWYLGVYGLLIIPIFFLIDKFVMKKRGPDQREVTQGTTVISLCGMLFITVIFLFTSNESLPAIAQFLVRGWIQMALLYFVIYHLTRFLTPRHRLRFKFGPG
jgi:hypothetical protein